MIKSFFLLRRCAIGVLVSALKVRRDCQESCVRGHSDADGGRIWRSRKIPWTVCWRGVTRRLFSPGRAIRRAEESFGGARFERGDRRPSGRRGGGGEAHSRNGYSKKTVLTETSKLDLRIPRDREGTFDPKLITRYQRWFPGFDEKIVSMYARGMTVREIQSPRRPPQGGQVR